MAECRVSVSSLKDTKTSTSDSHEATNVKIPDGKVAGVCKEWLVREDGVLAYRLQNEEITHHYEGNRNKSKTVREDIPLAKYLQRSEEDEATMMRLAYERMIQEQLEADERVAKEIADKLKEQEEGQKQIEEEDQKLAQKLQEKEKAKLVRKRLAREKQQVERVRTQLLGLSDGEDPVTELNQSIEALDLNDAEQQMLSQRVSSSDDDLDDLSEFLMQAPPGLSPAQLRQFQEEQDAEIARLLQEQELKRKKNINRDKTSVIEAQDHKIARILQKQEKERIRRLKEKVKQRQLRRQMMQQANNDFGASTSASTSSDNQRYRQTSNNGTIATYSDDSITYEEPYQVYHHNIAMDLDPTYKRHSRASGQQTSPNQTINTQKSPLRHSPVPMKISEGENPPSNQSIQTSNQAPDDGSNGIHFAQVYQVTPSSSASASPASTSTRRNDELTPDEETNAALALPLKMNRKSDSSNLNFENVPHAYGFQPVQGQRRSSTQKKTKSKKDNCKTQ